jgi:hypothetical protein
MVGVHLELRGYGQILRIKDRIHAVIKFKRIGDFNGSLDLRRTFDRVDGSLLD